MRTLSQALRPQSARYIGLGRTTEGAGEGDAADARDRNSGRDRDSGGERSRAGDRNLVAESEARIQRREAMAQAAAAQAKAAVERAREAAAAIKATGAGQAVGGTVGGLTLGPIGAAIGSKVGAIAEANVISKLQKSAFDAELDKAGLAPPGSSTTGGGTTTEARTSATTTPLHREMMPVNTIRTERQAPIQSSTVVDNRAPMVAEVTPGIQPSQAAPVKDDSNVPLLLGAGLLAAKILL